MPALIAGLFAAAVNTVFTADAPEADAKPAAEAAAVPAAAEKSAALVKKAHKVKRAKAGK